MVGGRRGVEVSAAVEMVEEAREEVAGMREEEVLEVVKTAEGKTEGVYLEEELEGVAEMEEEEKETVGGETAEGANEVVVEADLLEVEEKAKGKEVAAHWAVAEKAAGKMGEGAWVEAL